MVPHYCPGRISEVSWDLLVAPAPQASGEELKICPEANCEGEWGEACI